MVDLQRTTLALKIERIAYEHKVLAENAGFDGHRLEFEYQKGVEVGLMIALAMVITSAVCNGCNVVFPTEELKISTGRLRGKLICGYCWDNGQ